MPPHFPAGRLTAGKPAPRCAQDSAIYCFIKYYRIICGRASTRPVLRYVVRDKSHLPPVFRQRALRFSVLLQNGAENGLDRRRRERSGPGATTSRRMAVRHEGGDRTAAPQGPCPRAWRAEVRSGRKVTRSGAFGRRSRAKAHAARAGANQYASGNTLNLLPQQPPKCRLTAPGMRARCSAGSGKGLPPASKLFPPCADI